MVVTRNEILFIKFIKNYYGILIFILIDRVRAIINFNIRSNFKIDHINLITVKI